MQKNIGNFTTILKSQNIGTHLKGIREVSHQYEYDNDNEHVINSFSNNQMV
jgi:hypothetical protein